MNLIMTSKQVQGIIRHALTFIGGVLVTKGLIDEGVAAEITGGLMTLIGTIWSVIDKNKVN